MSAIKLFAYLSINKDDINLNVVGNKFISQFTALYLRN